LLNDALRLSSEYPSSSQPTELFPFRLDLIYAEAGSGNRNVANTKIMSRQGKFAFLSAGHPSFWRSALRRLGIVIGLVALFALGMRVAGPYLISSSVVRSAMERGISQWTGFRTVIKGDSDLAYWPSSRIVINQVLIYADNDQNKEPLIEIPRLVAFFDLFSMLRGVPDFSEFTFFKPTINLKSDENGALNWSSRGKLAQAIAFFQEPSADPGQFPKNLDLRLGDVRIENGIVNFQSIRGMTFTVSNITASIVWPKLTQPLTATVNAALNLNPFNLNLVAANPLPLMAGRNEPLDVSVQSNPLNLSFSGMTSLQNRGFINGHLSVQAPSLADLFLYAGLSEEKTGALNDFKLSSTVSSEGSTLRLNDLTFSVASTTASGVMDIGLEPHTLPQITGTLAFDRFSIDKAVEGFGPTASGAMDTSFFQRIRMDLRVSAEEATYSGLSLQKLAAGIRIGESAFLGGRLSGRLLVRDTSSSDKGGGSVDLRAEQIDLGALARAIPLTGPYPDAKGTIMLSASTDLPLPETSLANYHGTLEISALNGSVNHFSEAELRKVSASKKFFSLKETETGDYPFQSFTLTAGFADGIADIKTMQIIGRDSEIVIDGMVPYPAFSLALTGSLTQRADPSAPEALQMFIGGTLASAVLSPIPSTQNTRQ
jgi:AsmA protein